VLLHSSPRYSSRSLIYSSFGFGYVDDTGTCMNRHCMLPWRSQSFVVVVEESCGQLLNCMCVCGRSRIFIRLVLWVKFNGPYGKLYNFHVGLMAQLSNAKVHEENAEEEGCHTYTYIYISSSNLYYITSVCWVSAWRECRKLWLDGVCLKFTY